MLQPRHKGHEKNQRCSSSRKLVILFIDSSCYSFRARGIVSVICYVLLFVLLFNLDTWDSENLDSTVTAFVDVN